MIEQEGLDRYVRRVLHEKDLTLSEVERRAGGGISDSYVACITTGSIKNLTINKLKALARGLGVEEGHILAAACGVSLPDSTDFYASQFAALFFKYKQLSEGDQGEVYAVLQMLDREIERRLHNTCQQEHRKCPEEPC